MVNEKKLEIFVQGKGKQTIVIEPGMFCPLDDWMDIIDELSLYSNVITFHRPGYGQSELGDKPKTTENVSLILNELLEVLGINHPIVLVGHSYGGLCAQNFVKMYPEKVAGLVLVDSTSVNLHKLDELVLPISDEINSDEHWIQKCEKYSKMSKNNLQKELHPSLTPKQLRLPINSQKHLLEFPVNPNTYKAMALEIQNWKQCALHIKNKGVFPNVPLKIIGRDPQYSIKQAFGEGIPYDEAKQLETIWQQLIQEQTTLSRQSELIIAKDAGHSIHVDRPDIVIDAIKNLLYLIV